MRRLKPQLLMTGHRTSMFTSIPRQRLPAPPPFCKSVATVTIGTVTLALTDSGGGGWANGQGGPPTTVIDTKLEAAWAGLGAVDLSTVELSVGNDYNEASWSGTITIEYDVFEPAAITSFGPGAVVDPLVGNAANIAWTVPYGTDLTTLAPTFTLSSGTCDKTRAAPMTSTNTRWSTPSPTDPPSTPTP